MEIMILLSLVGDLLAAPAEVVVATKLHHVGQQVVALDDKVLDHHIDHGVRHLNTRDRDVADVLEDTGDDDVAEILEQVLLEDNLAVSVAAEILEQLLDRVGKSLVLRVLVELVGQELDLVKDLVGVGAVALADEVTALVVELVPLAVGLILHDEALLTQTFAGEC